VGDDREDSVGELFVGRKRPTVGVDAAQVALRLDDQRSRGVTTISSGAEPFIIIV
jgi:hypothetical protein